VTSTDEGEREQNAVATTRIRFSSAPMAAGRSAFIWRMHSVQRLWQDATRGTRQVHRRHGEGKNGVRTNVDRQQIADFLPIWLDDI
jgi:hypothetical protein